MKWTPEAETAIGRVPFFVRKKVRQRIENEAMAAGRRAVGLDDVKATQRHYLSRMASEVKGYRLETCFGPNGCPNRAMETDALVKRLDQILREAGLLDFLKQQVGEQLKFHHEFRLTVAECPNACSQPQIKDIGILGARRPHITDAPCSYCEKCQSACPDTAVTVREDHGPVIDFSRCLACGKCIDVCPTGTLLGDIKGYKVLLAGKLGRHPRLARELPGIFNEDAVLDIVKACIAFYKDKSRRGRRFADIFTQEDFQAFVDRYSKPQTMERKETGPC